MLVLSIRPGRCWIWDLTPGWMVVVPLTNLPGLTDLRIAFMGSKLIDHKGKERLKTSWKRCVAEESQ
jgi:hypothetical protein